MRATDRVRMAFLRGSCAGIVLAKRHRLLLDAASRRICGAPAEPERATVHRFGG